MNVRTWRFEAQDTLFFRESRPMDAIGGSELASVFPPPARTVIGAIRAAMGECVGVDWHSFANNQNYEVKGLRLHDEIGSADNVGKLSFSGPWLSLEGKDSWQRLYPVPGNILGIMIEKEIRDLVRLRVGRPLCCDLGENVRLPELPEGHLGCKPLEDCWLTPEGLKKVLMGELPLVDTLIPSAKLYVNEPRLGIARNNRQRTVKKGLLYQTRHIRPKSGVAVEMDVWNADQNLCPTQTRVRFGGEGRLATATVVERVAMAISKPRSDARNAYGIILILLTPALVNGNGAEIALLPGFAATKENGVSCWKGKLDPKNLSAKKVSLTLWSAITGRARREGGWDLANRKPRTVESLIPAGSMFYCTVDNGDIPAAIEALHLTRIGHEQEWGRGLLVVGLWTNEEIIGQETMK